MKTNQKRILSFILAVILIFGVLPGFSASAVGIESKGSINKNVSWVLYTNGKLVISGKGSTGSNEPYSLDFNTPFTSSSELNQQIKTVVIEEGITNICWGMFATCENLKSITIPKSVTKIGALAFAYCSKLAKVTLPATVTEIGSMAFWNCINLKTITIPKGVTKIGEEAFRACSFLEQINVDKNNKAFSSSNGILYNKNKTEVIKCPQAMKEIKIAKSVTKIGVSAFENCRYLKSITIPNKVTCIDDFAFSECAKLSQISIPNTVTRIGAFALYGCSKLSKITIPKSVTSIGSYAFAGTAYEANDKNWKDDLLYIGDCLVEALSTSSTCNIKSGTRVIADAAFEYSDMKKVVIPESVTHIGVNAFISCPSMKSITIPSGVKSIGIGAFVDCTGLKEINVADKNKKYASLDGVLYNKSKTTLIYCPGAKKSVTIPKSVTKISQEAFLESSLTKITVPNGVKSIGSFAFAYSTKLKSVSIPKSVTSIAKDAFEGCSKLSEINVNGSNAKYSSSKGILYNKNKTTLIKCPAAKTEVTIPKTVTKIGDYAFGGCSKLKTVTVPKKVTSIGNSAFYGCTKLKSIKIYNPDCKIYNSLLTISSTATIYGYKNSTADKYAKRFDLKFKQL